MKVLVVRFSSIGDIVLTTPVMRVLKTQADAEVHFLTKKKFAGIVEPNPYIDKVWLLEDSLNKIIEEIKKEGFEHIIDLHHNLRTLILKLKTGIKTTSFNKINWEKWLIVNLKINKLPNKHIVDRYLETVEHLGVKNDNLGLDFFIKESDEVPIDWLPETHREEYIAYAIGGQHETKKLPVSRMIELCDKINKPIILLGGPEDFENGEQIEKFFKQNDEGKSFEEGLTELGKKTIIFNGCGKFSLGQSASVAKKAKYVFAHDTGMMHISAALKKNVFSIWGCTVPAFGMYPYQTKFTVLENPNLSCRPCSKIGYKKCPKGHFKCMNDMKFDFYIP